MPRYDASRYGPPAPIAMVALRDIRGSVLLPNVAMLLDTGADITLLPRTSVIRLGVKPANGISYELVGFDGNKSMAEAVELDMIFLGKAFRGRYLLIDDDQGILGRDVLASIVVLLDGPRQEWSEYQGYKSQ